MVKNLVPKQGRFEKANETFKSLEKQAIIAFKNIFAKVQTINRFVDQNKLNLQNIQGFTILAEGHITQINKKDENKSDPYIIHTYDVLGKNNELNRTIPMLSYSSNENEWITIEFSIIKQTFSLIALNQNSKQITIKSVHPDNDWTDSTPKTSEENQEICKQVYNELLPKIEHIISDLHETILSMENKQTQEHQENITKMLCSSIRELTKLLK